MRRSAYQSALQHLMRWALITFFPFTAFAQLQITGKIVDAGTHQGIEGASVYVNNTAVGTSSGKGGAFLLINGQLSNAELIVSCVGYERVVINITAADAADKSFTIELVQKAKLIREVLIVSDATRKKWMRLFYENFLGITEEAELSKLTNEEAIYFTKGNGPNGFFAYADTPLVIINQRLGYKIHFELVEFGFDQTSGSTYFYGYTRFESMGDKKRWIKNRERCYGGSTMHFFRSLIRNRLAEEGFLIYLLKPIRLDKGEKLPINTPVFQKSANVAEAAFRTSRSEILQPDTTQQSGYLLVLDGKRLMVQYKKEPAMVAYLKTKVLLEGGGYRSFIGLQNKTLSLDASGIPLNPLEAVYQGYWIYEKAANLLPFDYVPEK